MTRRVMVLLLRALAAPVSRIVRDALLLALLPGAALAQSGQVQLAVGPFFMAGGGGADARLAWQQPDGRWVYGVRWASWTDEFHDPFDWQVLTRTTNTLIGPQVEYRFQPAQKSSWYVGVSALRWSKAEHAELTGETGKDTAIAPFVGGGYSGTFATHFFYNLGMFLAPGAKLETSTSVSSEEDSGLFDVQAQFGLAF